MKTLCALCEFKNSAPANAARLGMSHVNTALYNLSNANMIAQTSTLALAPGLRLQTERTPTPI